MDFIQDKILTSQDYEHEGFPAREVENCSFRNCNFSRVDLSGVRFSECEFTECDFSTAQIRNTGFQEVDFKDCKLMGLAFENCSDFLLSVTFENCLLDFSSFYRLKIPNTRFLNCQLREVDFSEAVLYKSIFSNCDLSGAIFQHSRLENCDFRTSSNYSIDPEKNSLTNAYFSLSEIVGLLDKYKIKVG